MPDLSQDLVINVLHNQIKRSIRLLLDERCFGAAVLLILSGVDTMAYLGMPASQSDVSRKDFIGWANSYIQFPCADQLSGEDLYGARCSMLHQYGAVSEMSRSGKCRMLAYMSESIPEIRFDPKVNSDLVLVSVPALADTFFSGVDRFLVDVFSDPTRRSVAEQRLQTLMRQTPVTQ